MKLRADPVVPGRLKFIPCDVSDEVQVREAVASVVGPWGRVDVLINNACLCQFAPFAQKDSAQWRREFDMNFFGYVRTIAAVVPFMMGQGGGIIYNQFGITVSLMHPPLTAKAREGGFSPAP